MSSSRPHVDPTPSEPSGTTGRGIVDATELCTDLTYQTLLLEKQLGDGQPNAFGTFLTMRSARISHLDSDIAAVQAILGRSTPWLASAVQMTSDGTKQAGIKVVQAVEKFRRLVIRAKGLDLNDIITRTLAQLLHDVAACFDSAFGQVRPHLWTPYS